MYSSQMHIFVLLWVGKTNKQTTFLCSFGVIHTGEFVPHFVNSFSLFSISVLQEEVQKY